MVMPGLLGIGLFVRSGIGKRLDGLGGVLGLEQPRKRRDVDAKASRIGELRHQAEIGQRWLGAEAERTGLMCDQLLASLEALAIGPAGPGRDLVFRQA